MAHSFKVYVALSASLLLRALATSVTDGWTSVGCYTDSRDSRTLRTASFTSVDDMTVSDCISFCATGNYKYAGLEFGRECYCDNNIHTPAAPANVADCNMTCTGDQTSTCGGVDRISIVTASRTPLGCYTDSRDSRTLRTASFTSVDDMTIQSCIDFCAVGNYQYAGLEFGRECYCDNIIQTPAVQVNLGQCNMTCTGDGTTFCGAADRISISTLSWTTLGCYTDSRDSRTLRTASFTSVEDMTIQSCLDFCTAGQYQFAGLEFGRECYCDNTIRTPATSTDIEDCNVPCTGDSDAFCGGVDRISIATFTSSLT
ncbi:WSC domain-containing protein [Crucibulum laeve]|uniref:WSC domain-containing protein n=1 Tax=Crucibulum laeve TaxID=68775 RepID=A0A5C3M3Q3_9AGAR|nr:WSC domain-containing protein [Crucibulum laeve]